MERKGWIVGVVVLVAAGILVAVLWSGEGDQSDEAARVARTEDGASSGSDGSHVGSSAAGDQGPLRSGSRRADTVVDGGVRGRSPSRPPAVNTHGELRRGEEDADRSAGWRLGKTRAQIALVDTRITRLRERLAELEQQGDSEAAEEQRTVLRRFEARLTNLRAEETTLDAQAREDGTMGDVAEGMREGVDPTQGTRPPPTRVP